MDPSIDSSWQNRIRIQAFKLPLNVEEIKTFSNSILYLPYYPYLASGDYSDFQFEQQSMRHFLPQIRNQKICLRLILIQIRGSECESITLEETQSKNEE
jgi:hypothetical protein